MVADTIGQPLIAALSIWYLVRPPPLLVQGEVDATRFDIAAHRSTRRRSSGMSAYLDWRKHE